MNDDDDTELFVKPIPYHEEHWWSGPAERRANYQTFKATHAQVMERVSKIVEEDRSPISQLPEELHLTEHDFDLIKPKQCTEAELENAVSELIAAIYLVKTRLSERDYEQRRFINVAKDFEEIHFVTLSSRETLECIRNDLDAILMRCMR